MTACIVGLAHTPFGKLDAETVESLVVRVANEALADAGIEARDVDEIVLGHFNGGFTAQNFTAALVLQADPAFRFKPATRVENACATGSAAVHQGIKAIASGSARIVLVVGVEQMTKTPGPEVGQDSLERFVLAGGRRHRGRLRRDFRQDRGPLFPALWRPVRRAGADRRQEPQERRRQSLCAVAQGPWLRVLPHREREKPARGGAPEAHRLLAGDRRRGGGGAGGRFDRAAARQARGRDPRDGACAGFPAHVQARHSQVRGLQRGLAAGAGAGGRRDLRSLLRRNARLLHRGGADRIRGHGPRQARPGRARHRRGHHREDREDCRSIRRAGSSPRAIRSAPRACRCMP